MRLTTYQEIEAGIADEVGLTVDSTTGNPSLQTDEFHLVKRAVSRGLALIWDAFWWPELMRVERRQYRDSYDSATAYTAGDEVYDVQSDLYYVALRASTGQAPSSWSGGEWVTNEAYWGKSARAYVANDYESTTAYVVGDQVYFPETGLVYQCHTASTGNDPTDESYWGEMVEFVPYVSLIQSGFTAIGRIKGVWSDDPRRFAGARPIDYTRGTDRIEFASPVQTRVWIEYQLRCPALTGAVYSSTTAYTAVDEESATGSTVIVTTDLSGTGYRGRAALRARTEHVADQVAYLLYLVTSGDGQGGWFYFNSTSTTADDGVDVLRPDDVASGSPGRWIRNS